MILTDEFSFAPKQSVQLHVSIYFDENKTRLKSKVFSLERRYTKVSVSSASSTNVVVGRRGLGGFSSIP